MIDKNVVTRIVDEWLEGKDYFLVDVTVSPDDKIVVEIDHAEGCGLTIVWNLAAILSLNWTVRRRIMNWK